VNNNRRPPSVLVVEDDRVIAGSIGAHLRHAGMAVECVEDGDRALRKVRFERPDAVVLDLMLPGLDGWQVLRELRAGGTECPIVVVSARASEQDKVQVLKMGADDYVAKPFGMSELVARVEAVLRRSRITPQVGRPEKLTMPGLEIDPDLHRVLVDGADAGLTPLEFRLLQALTSESGRVLTRDQLRQRVWGVPQRKRDRSVDVCVRKLRSKIDLRSRTYVYIHTHPGVGYRFDPVPR
jgi:DNA-binding response OmpR family regulator